MRKSNDDKTVHNVCLLVECALNGLFIFQVTPKYSE